MYSAETALYGSIKVKDPIKKALNDFFRGNIETPRYFKEARALSIDKNMQTISFSVEVDIVIRYLLKLRWNCGIEVNVSDGMDLH